MDFTQIRYQIEHRVAIITLYRPECMNAFTTVMASELVEAFRMADSDDEVRAIIFTGDGKVFCAGADLSLGADAFNYDESKDGDDLSRIRDTGGMVTLAMYDCRKPIICAINGAAVGIGATMILAADIRLAVEKARFGFVFARRGIVPEAASTWFLPRIVGMSQALEWMFTGHVFDAQEALRGRLVKALYPDRDALMSAATRMAQDIADNTSAVSIALIRQMMWRLSAADHPVEAHKIDSRGVYYTGKSADAREGVTSFLEKRPAHFTDSASSDMPEFYPWWKARYFE